MPSGDGWYEEKSDKTIKHSNCERFAMDQIKAHPIDVFGYKLMKSLILAQDERWRHA